MSKAKTDRCNSVLRERFDFACFQLVRAKNHLRKARHAAEHLDQVRLNNQAEADAIRYRVTVFRDDVAKRRGEFFRWMVRLKARGQALPRVVL